MIVRRLMPVEIARLGASRPDRHDGPSTMGSGDRQMLVLRKLARMR